MHPLQVPGLYKLEIGFFCASKPVVQVLVDGSAIMTLVGGGSPSSLHHRPPPRSSGGGKAVNATGFNDLAALDSGLPPHPAGILAGYSAAEFVSLPQNARISIQFSGARSDQTKAEGFISLVKY